MRHINHNDFSVFDERIKTLSLSPSLLIGNKDSTSMMMHCDFESFEGRYEPVPLLTLNLCTAYSGRFERVDHHARINGVLRPGSVAIALPNTQGDGFWPKTQMLGIAIDLKNFFNDVSDCYKPDDFSHAASQLHQDPMLTAVMTALWRDAEIHGLSSAFFEYGINALFKRLLSIEKPVVSTNSVKKLSGSRLKQVLDFIESRLESDLRVSDLTALTQQDARTFTRSFTAATGLAPYAYFTLRRMQYAQTLLTQKTLSITEIAIRVGYANPSKFSAAFKRVHAISPRDFRRQIAN